MASNSTPPYAPLGACGLILFMSTSASSHRPFPEWHITLQWRYRGSIRLEQ